MEQYDVVVVGGGIAGTSIGYELASERSVLVLEGERELGRHTTGRSAATWIGSYGPAEVRRLTHASLPLLTDPELDVAGPLLTDLPCLYVGGAGSSDQVAMLVEETGIRALSAAEAEELNPVLRPGWTESAALDEDAREIDVAGLHQGYVRGLKKRDGTIRLAARLVAATRRADAWELNLDDGPSVAAGTVVNAAGAWGDQVGELFGSPGVNLMPLRRSMFSSPTDESVRGLPMTCSIAGDWYFKAEGDTVLCSPEDAEPTQPGDPRADELEVARAIEAINEATTLGLRSVRTSWAGLRTFAPSGVPVARYDEQVPGLFWFVGQGGYGIQLAPALAKEAATLLP